MTEFVTLLLRSPDNLQVSEREIQALKRGLTNSAQVPQKHLVYEDYSTAPSSLPPRPVLHQGWPDSYPGLVHQSLAC